MMWQGAVQKTTAQNKPFCQRGTCTVQTKIRNICRSRRITGCEKPIAIRSWATVAGRKEGRGKLAQYYDFILEHNQFGEKSWERAEQKMQQYALELALEKANLTASQLDYFLGGDLLNQIIATSYTARAANIPYFGLYGACSSLAEGFILGSCLLDGK